MVATAAIAAAVVVMRTTAAAAAISSIAGTVSSRAASVTARCRVRDTPPQLAPLIQIFLLVIVGVTTLSEHKTPA